MTDAPGNIPTQVVYLCDPNQPSLEFGEVASLFTVELKLRGDEDMSQLLTILGREFLLPYEATGFDVVLDLLSDLDWIGRDEGYRVIVRIEADRPIGSDTPVGKFVSIIPDLCDRWHTGNTTFQVIFVARATARATILKILEDANASIRKARELPWFRDLQEVEIRTCE